MLNKEIKIGAATLYIYKPNLAVNCPAMLVLPGGGYGAICTEREGEPIALAYAARGFVSAVLHYSILENAKDSTPLSEATAAVAYLRKNAKELGIDPEKVYSVGFSAGGHLSASLATLWHREKVMAKAGTVGEEGKPTASVMCYPVVSGVDHPHLPSFYNITGTQTPTAQQLNEWSIEQHVDEKSAPAFIIHTAEDSLVPVHNSIALGRAYADAGIQFELHIYPHGEHGFALGSDVTICGNPDLMDEKYARWVDDSIYFFNHLK